MFEENKFADVLAVRMERENQRCRKVISSSSSGNRHFLRSANEGTTSVSDPATEEEVGENKTKRITSLSGFENTVAFLTKDFLQELSPTLAMMRE